MRRCRHKDSLMLSNFYSRAFESERDLRRRQIGICGGILLQNIAEEDILEDEGGGTGGESGGGSGGEAGGGPDVGPDREEDGGQEEGPEGGQEGGPEGGQEGGQEGGPEGELREEQEGEVRLLRDRERVDYSVFY